MDNIDSVWLFVESGSLKKWTRAWFPDGIRTAGDLIGYIKRGGLVDVYQDPGVKLGSSVTTRIIGKLTVIATVKE